VITATCFGVCNVSDIIDAIHNINQWLLCLSAIKSLSQEDLVKLDDCFNGIKTETTKIRLAMVTNIEPQDLEKSE